MPGVFSRLIQIVQWVMGKNWNMDEESLSLLYKSANKIVPNRKMGTKILHQIRKLRQHINVQLFALYGNLLDKRS